MNQHPLSLVELRGFMNLYDDLWNESDNNIDPEKLIVLINNVLSLLELHPQSSSLWERLGDLLQFTEDESSPTPITATEAYTRAISLDPFSADLYESLGYLCYTFNDPAAEELFLKATTLKRSVTSLLGLAAVQRESGKLEEVAELIKEARRLTQKLNLEIDNFAADTESPE